MSTEAEELEADADEEAAERRARERRRILSIATLWGATGLLLVLSVVALRVVEPRVPPDHRLAEAQDALPEDGSIRISWVTGRTRPLEGEVETGEITTGVVELAIVGTRLDISTGEAHPHDALRVLRSGEWRKGQVTELRPARERGLRIHHIRVGGLQDSKGRAIVVEYWIWENDAIRRTRVTTSLPDNAALYLTADYAGVSQ